MTTLHLQAVRIYGSPAKYGTERCSYPGKTPIVLRRYPTARDQTKVYLGEAPDDLIRAELSRRARGMAWLQFTFWGEAGANLTVDQLIEAELRDDTFSSQISALNWFLSIVIERSVEVVDEEINVEEDGLLKASVIRSRIEEFGSNSFPHVDRIAAYLSPLIDAQFFERKVINDAVFITTPGLDSFAFPRISASAEMTVNPGLSSLNVGEIERMLEAVAQAAPQKHEWLDEVARWHLLGFQEKDRWKRFLWSFLALELLVNKLAPELYAGTQVGIGPHVQSGEHSIGELVPISELQSDIERLRLRDKFKIVASRLAPQDAAQDIDCFRRAYQARNKLAHGSLQGPNGLPTSDVQRLVQTYLLAAFRYKLSAKASD